MAKKTHFDELLQLLSNMHEQKILFNKVLGLQIESPKTENVRLKFKMKWEQESILLDEADTDLLKMKGVKLELLLTNKREQISCRFKPMGFK